jgi:hypothetical protein
MSSLELEAEAKPDTELGTVFRLLDPLFGHFLWAAHFLVIYIAAALACTLGIDMASTGVRTAFVATLALITLGAAALLFLHGRRRYRQYSGVEDKAFRLAVTLGNSAIAAVGIVWQLFPILLSPLCR